MLAMIPGYTQQLSIPRHNPSELQPHANTLRATNELLQGETYCAQVRTGELATPPVVGPTAAAYGVRHVETGERSVWAGAFSGRIVRGRKPAAPTLPRLVFALGALHLDGAAVGEAA